MNSRDAAYDESLQAIIEASAAEARAATMSPVVAAHKEETKSNHDPEPEPEEDACMDAVEGGTGEDVPEVMGEFFLDEAGEE